MPHDIIQYSHTPHTLINDIILGSCPERAFTVDLWQLEAKHIVCAIETCINGQGIHY